MPRNFIADRAAGASARIDLAHIVSPVNVKLKGEARHWAIAGDSGNIKTHSFCPTCGSPVYLTFTAMPDLFTVHAASLDDPSRYEPQMVTYGVRGYAWDHIDPALPKFDKMASAGAAPDMGPT